MKRALTWCVAVLFLLPLLPLASCEEQGVIQVTYVFEGIHAEEAGFAQGTITLTPRAEEAASNGYYLLYFADKHGVLADCDEFASIPITGDTVTHTVKDGTLLPPDATALAVFESSEKFLDEPPAFSSRVGLITIPKHKRLILEGTPYRFGAVSDVHMNYDVHGRGAYQKWEDTLNFFAANGMNDVIVAGDMTGDEFEGTLFMQYMKYREIIDASDYPAEHIYEAIGNHGNTARGRKQFVTYTKGPEQKHPTEDSPWFSLLRKGDNRDTLFLFMAQELKAPGDSAAYDNFSKEQIDWLEEMLDAYSPTDTNIFIILHSPFLNYGPGDRHGGDYTTMIPFKNDYLQTRRLKKLLETHRQVIVLSGHTHLSLYDGENYSDENGTSCRMVHVGSSCHPTSYNNGNNKLSAGDGRYAVSPTYGSEAYTVAVYEDYILFTGHNLSTGKRIPSACYILPTTVV